MAVCADAMWPRYFVFGVLLHGDAELVNSILVDATDLGLPVCFIIIVGLDWFLD